MKKLQLLGLMLAGTLGLNAQLKTDSLKKYRCSGIIVESNALYRGGPHYSLDRSDFQKFVTNQTLLNQDLTGYTNTGYSPRVYQYSKSFSIRAFVELGKGKRFRREGFIGAKIGRAEASRAFYYKESRDTTGIYTNTPNNATTYSVTKINSSYSYAISALQIFVPMGINLTTDKNKHFWFAAGIEVSPGISCANEFTSRYISQKKEVLLNSPNLVDNENFAAEQILDTKTTKETIKGIGFVGYASLPLAVNVRVSKKIKILKNIDLNATLSPRAYYTNNRFVGSKTDLAFNTSFGLRYNW